MPSRTSRKSGRSRLSTKQTLWLIVAVVIAILIYEAFTGPSESKWENVKMFVTETLTGKKQSPQNNNTDDNNDPVDNQSDQRSEVTSNTLAIQTLAEGYPSAIKGEEIHAYTGFDLSYNDKHEQANWVAYIHTRDKVKRDVADRSDNFRADDNIQGGSATPADYRRSGYDRGHIAPADDMDWSKESEDESFLMSNMSPQLHEFNAGIWKTLEEKVRDWAYEYKKIYVIAGPMFDKIDGTIGDSKVSIPRYYFKVILDIEGPDYKGIGFIMKNEGTDQPLSAFAMTIDEVEQKTGIDFFANITSPDIETIESQMNIADWNLDAQKDDRRRN